MTEQEIFDKLVSHHEETGDVMWPTMFAKLFHKADPQAMVRAIYRFNEYLEGRRKEVNEIYRD